LKDIDIRRYRTMITYLYWLFIIACAVGVLLLFARVDNLKAGVIGALVVVFTGWLAYVFHFEQVFVKRYGGVMTVTVPDGQVHIAATWKGDHLWVENYAPQTNTCHFNEYSRGNILQGKVIIKNCNPRLRELATPPSPVPMQGQGRE
jgi:hypothetical protein